jgi:hypothetical protein
MTPRKAARAASYVKAQRAALLPAGDTTTGDAIG